MPERRATSWMLLPAAVAIVAAGYAWGRSAANQPSQYDEAAAPYVPSSAEARDARAERAARLAFLDGLRRRVDTETPDPAWREATEAAIRRLIPARLGPQVTVTEAKCASTICRATLLHRGSPRIPDDKFMAFTLDREPLGSLEIQLDTRSEGSTTLYFLRPRAAPAAR